MRNTGHISKMANGMVASYAPHMGRLARIRALAVGLTRASHECSGRGERVPLLI